MLRLVEAEVEAEVKTDYSLLSSALGGCVGKTRRTKERWHARGFVGSMMVMMASLAAPAEDLLIF